MSKCKVLIERRTVRGVVDLEQLKQDFPQADIAVTDTPESLKALIQDAEVFFGIPTPEVYQAARKLRWLQALSAGVDWLGRLPGIVESDVIVTNTRGAHAQTIAEHTFALILSLTRRMKTQLLNQMAHKWARQEEGGAHEGLAGQTMGIVGLGQIGSAIARRAHAFEMDVYAVDVQPFPHMPDLRGRWGLNRLDELCRISDFLVISAPLTAETRGLIDARRLGLMKPTAYLIVVSRGNIVDEPALIEVLKNGKIAGAGLDVTSVEPLPADSPLWDMENVVVTPHNSGSSSATFRLVWAIFEENLSRYLSGKPLLNLVDKRAGY